MDTKAKQRILYIIFSIMFFVCFIFAYSTKQIHFSHKSRFYDNEFYFSIKSPKNTKIFYTLDSSEPTVNSLTYSKPIIILKYCYCRKFFSRSVLIRALDWKKEVWALVSFQVQGESNLFPYSSECTFNV